MISSDNSDEILTDNADTIAHMDDHDNPMVRMFALGKVTKLMRKYQNDTPLNKIDENTKRLLKGFYTANKNELEGDNEDAYEFQIDKERLNKIMSQY